MGLGAGEGEPRKEMEQCMQVYEDDSMVQWCEPVLVAVQQLGLDVLNRSQEGEFH